MDFKAGIVTLGREWHQRVETNPDSLADHPAVLQAAAGGNPYLLFAESVSYASAYAFEQITGDEEAYHEVRSSTTTEDGDSANDMGEDFDSTIPKR